MEKELRGDKRRSVYHPVVYTAMDSDGEIRTRGVGRALDFSPNGLMLETPEPIREENLRVRIAASDGEAIAADGVLIYSFLYGPKTYRTGIKLVGPHEAVDEFISRLRHINQMDS